MLGLRASCRHVLKATSAVHQRPNSVMRRWYTSGDFKFEDIWKNNREWANSKRGKLSLRLHDEFQSCQSHS